jgi:hypothetical protein
MNDDFYLVGEAYAGMLPVLHDATTLDLDDDTLPWILDHVDNFVDRCRGNKGVEKVRLYPYDFDGRDDDVWEKIGQVIGNLHALEKLYISNTTDRTFEEHDEETVAATSNWDRLACILGHVRQKVRVELDGRIQWSAGDAKAVIRVIRGHPTITSFDSCDDLPCAD